MSDGFWRAMFFSAAIFNWVVGVSLMFDSSGLAASMGIEAMRYDALYSPVLGWLVIAFGLLYFAVSRDLAQNRTIVWVGALGKAGTVVLTWAAWLRGEAPVSLAMLVAVDVIYTLLFVWFLATRRGTQAV